jgi:tripartite-type tricarboxylate transporter receptor subunit TctC
MEETRMTRLSLKLATALVVGGVTATAAQADFPTRPVTIIVPFAAGGGTDITTRALAEEMANSLGVQVVVKNTDGAGGTIGTAETAQARADGYTIGMMPVGPMTTQPHMRDLPYGPDSFDYICLAYSAPPTLLVRHDSEFNTLEDLLEYGRQNPGELNFALPAIGSIPHVSALALAEAGGIEFTYIPFTGDAPSFRAVLDGSVHTFISHISFLTQNSDQAKALAVLTNERVEIAPDIPTATEQGVEMHFPIWGGLVAPKGIPAEARDRLEEACAEGSQAEGYVERMTQLRTPVSFMSGAEFEEFVHAEFERNGELLEAAGFTEQ